VNDRHEIFGWAMYDWANSAFATTVSAVFLGPYLTTLAKAASDKNGFVYLLGIQIAPASFLPYAVSLSALLQVLILPILGAIADYSHLRKRMLMIFTTLGATATTLLFFVEGNLWWLGGVLYLIASLSFAACIVFYNSYLPDIASEDQRDRVSSFGWALGYLGGGLLLVFNLAFYQTSAWIFGEANTGLAVRLNLASAGIWWMGWSIWTFMTLRSRNGVPKLFGGEAYLKIGFREMAATLHEMRRYPQTLRFLLAYLIYNDGVQTVVVTAAIFGAEALKISQSTLVLVILMVQLVAFFGALLFGRIAGLVSAKTAVLISLVIWSGTAFYTYGFLSSEFEFWLLGGVIGLVLGGSQALSRSIYAQMIPKDREAEFFSFYELADRGSSLLGPLVFGLTNQWLGSLRYAALSVSFFFVAGLALLTRVNVQKAIQDSRVRQTHDPTVRR